MLWPCAAFLIVTPGRPGRRAVTVFNAHRKQGIAVMTALSGENIAFIGLGLMGRPMALNLEKAGAILTVNTATETLNAL